MGKDGNGGNGGGNKTEGGGGGNKSGGGGAKKPDEFQPHPVNDQLPGVKFCVNSPPPWPEAIALGFQNYILSLGITVLIPNILVPLMGGDIEQKAKVIKTLLFVSGLNTLLQSLFGCRLPTVVVASYAYMIPTISIILGQNPSHFLNPNDRFIFTMRRIQGALICASAFKMMLGFSGMWRIFARCLSPLSAASLVTFTGFGLYQLGFPMLANCVIIGLLSLILLVFVSQYFTLMRPQGGLYDRYAVLFTVTVMWTCAAVLTTAGVYDKDSEISHTPCHTNRPGLISKSKWISIPYPFQWGSPLFDVGEAFGMIAASLVALTESTGAFIATSRFGSATPVPPSILSRGAGWLGIGVLLDGFFGTGIGSTISVENAGLLGLTKVGSRRVSQITAGFMLLFSIFGKVGVIFASIPLSIVAAVYCICFAYVSSAGLGFLQFCNLNSFRTKFILGFSFFMGLSVPQFFREYGHAYGRQVHTHAIWFNDMVNVIFMSHAFVAVTVAMFLDCTLSRKDEGTRKDRGSHWWEKFMLYATDERSDEFYSLPFKLNKFFQPL